VVYVGSNDGFLYALNAGTGARLWSFLTGASVTSSPTVANGVVYVGSNDGFLYAFNLAGGVRAKLTLKPPDPSTLVPDYTLTVDGR
jgi:outer membrane protein assembly factor BamB